MERNIRIGFIGAGNMTKAIVEGILKANLCSPSNIYISHPSAKDFKKFAYLEIYNEFETNQTVVENSDIIFLCVKPQILEHICSKINHLINENHLIISICAGITLKKLVSFLSSNLNGQSIRVARCMLNTAALVGSSCSVFSQNGTLNDLDKNLIKKLLSSIGSCIGEIKDSEMDAAMSICACGIAYMYMMVDSMADGGVKMGLSREIALKLSMHTMKGASDIMISQLGIKHPMQLKDEVCSPGGTTIQGVHELEKNGFRNSVICAIESATNRAREFS